MRGIDVCRKIYIDGEVPFAEMSDYHFGYEQNWREDTLSDTDGNPYDFYLEAGTHTIRMEVVLGNMADIISQVQETVQQLNAIYRQVIYITGVSPDKYRDYQIEASLPNLEGELIEARAGIASALEALRKTAGKSEELSSAAWIAADKADYDYNGANGSTLSFDTVYVQWPVGPSGNADTNAGKVSAGEYYIIPAGVKDPETVYHVLYDMWNWYDGDTAVRDDEETLFWWYAVTAKDEELQDENFDVMFDVGSRETFELWNSIGISYDFMSLLKGEVTPAQFQKTYKNQVQDALDIYFN